MNSTSPARTSRRGRLRGYAVLLLALSLVGTLYTAISSASSEAPELGTDQSLAIREGRDLYLTGCSTCHGLNLEGGAGGPSLIGVGSSAVVFQVESGRMPLSAGIQQAQRKPPKYDLVETLQLAAYVQSIGGGVELPSYNNVELADGDLQLGGSLFRTNCASCHNFAGSGGALTYGKYAPELEEASARVIYSAMQSGPESMPRYGDNQLLPEEKRAITRYVTYLNDTAPNPGGAGLGRYGPISEGLVAWVVGVVAMVALTLWIGSRS